MSEWSEKNSSQTTLQLRKYFGIKENKFVVQFRESSKKFIIEFLTKNIALNLSGALFFVGLGYSLKWWYKDQLFVILLKQNLPAFSEPQQKISWETSDYILNQIKEQDQRLAKKNSLEEDFYTCKCISSLTWLNKSISNGSEEPAQVLGLEESHSKAPFSYLFDTNPSYVCKDQNDIQMSNADKKKQTYSYGVQGSGVNKKVGDTRSIFSPVEIQLDKQFGISYRLIDRIDLYSNQTVVKLKQPWQKHVYQKFIGIFPELSQVTEHKKLLQNNIPFLTPAFHGEPALAEILNSKKIAVSNKPICHKNIKFRDCAVGKRINSQEQEKFSIYTPVKPLFPERWFKLSARSFCFFNQNFLPSRSFQLFQVSNSEKITKQAWHKFCDSKKFVNKVLSPLRPTILSSPSVSVEAGSYKNSGILNTKFTKLQKFIFPKKKVSFYEFSAEKQHSIKNKVSTFPNATLGKTIKTLLAYLPSNKVHSKAINESIKLKQLSYPLELTKTLTGWQPSLDLLILNYYLDEIPYKLENVLQSYFPKKDSELLFLSTSFLKSRIPSFILPLKTSNSFIQKNANFSKLSEKKDASNIIVNEKKASETYLKKLQIDKIKQLLQNELQSLISALPLTQINNFFLNQPLQTSFHSQESNVSQSISKELHFGTKPKIGLKKSDSLPLFSSLNSAQVEDEILFPKGKNNIQEKTFLQSSDEGKIINGELQNKYPNVSKLPILEKKSVVDVTRKILGVKTNSYPKAGLYPPYLHKHYGISATEDLFFPSTPTLSNKKNRIDDINSKTLALYDASNEKTSNNEMSISFEPFKAKEDFSISSVQGSSALTNFFKNQSLDPLLLLNKLGFTFNNISPLTNPTILLPTSTNSFPSFLTPTAVRLWKQLVFANLTNVSATYVSPEQDYLNGNNDILYNKAKSNDLLSTESIDLKSSNVERILLQQKLTNLNQFFPFFLSSPPSKDSQKTQNNFFLDDLKENINFSGYGNNATQPLQGKTSLNHVPILFHFNSNNLTWEIFQQPNYDQYLLPTLKNKNFFISNQFSEREKGLKIQKLAKIRFISQNGLKNSNFENVVNSEPRLGKKPFPFLKNKVSKSQETKNILQSPKEATTSLDNKLLLHLQNQESKPVNSKSKIGIELNFTNHIKKIKFRQKKNTFAAFYNVNSVDKEVNFANKKSRCMSGYVYPEIQSDSLKIYLNQCIGKSTNPIFLASQKVFLPLVNPLKFSFETSLIQLLDGACLTSIKIPVTPTTFLLRFFQQQPYRASTQLLFENNILRQEPCETYKVESPSYSKKRDQSNHLLLRNGIASAIKVPYQKFNHYLAQFPGFSGNLQSSISDTKDTSSFSFISSDQKEWQSFGKQANLGHDFIVADLQSSKGIINEVDRVTPLAKQSLYNGNTFKEINEKHEFRDGEINKFFVNCNPRKVAYHGIVVQRNNLTKDFQPFKGFLKQSSIWGTRFLGAENPLTDRQCHFFAQKQLSTLDTNSLQRDYLRQLGKEILMQSNSKGFAELSKSSSIERTKILSVSKKVNSFLFKKRKYSYLLEPKDQWYILFQEQLRTALKDSRKYPALQSEGSDRHFSKETKSDSTNRIKVSAPLIMARFPKEIARLSLLNNKHNKIFPASPNYLPKELDLEHDLSWRPFCYVEPSQLLMPRIFSFSGREIYQNPATSSQTKALGPLTPLKKNILSCETEETYFQKESTNKIIQHYPLFTERFSLELNDRSWLNKKFLFNNFTNFLSLHSLIQQPLNANSWAVVNQWVFLLAILLWIEQILLNNVLPSLFALEQILLGVTGIKTGDRTHVIRISKSETPKFQNLAGVDGLLGELSELVLFLRGQQKIGERFWNKKNSYGILLTGPPGTGKTFLVRALANEAHVPVLILSASTLATNKLNSNKPSWSIRHAFRRAKQLSPCILFIDEIDALGKSRGKIVTDINEIVTDANLSSINQSQLQLPTSFANPDNSSNIYSYEQFGQYWPSISNLLLKKWENPLRSTFLQEFNEINRNSLCQEKLFDLLKGEKNQNLDQANYGNTLGKNNKKRDFEAMENVQKSHHSNQNEMTQDSTRVEENTKRKFGPLTQLLVSMDGVSSISGVLIMGATNRPELLDPALTRPGRFEKIIRIEKPSEQNRIEILQLYSHNLGVQQQIPWAYLANRTRGLTTADLAVAMNYSSLKAISEGNLHTIETIEYGLNCIARSFNTSFFSSKKLTTIPIKVNLKKNKTNRKARFFNPQTLLSKEGKNPSTSLMTESSFAEHSISFYSQTKICRHFNLKGIINEVDRLDPKRSFALIRNSVSTIPRFANINQVDGVDINPDLESQRGLKAKVLPLRASKAIHYTFFYPQKRSHEQQAIPSTKIKSKGLAIFSSYSISNFLSSKVGRISIVQNSFYSVPQCLQSVALRGLGNKDVFKRKLTQFNFYPAFAQYTSKNCFICKAQDVIDYKASLCKEVDKLYKKDRNSSRMQSSGKCRINPFFSEKCYGIRAHVFLPYQACSKLRAIDSINSVDDSQSLLGNNNRLVSHTIKPVKVALKYSKKQYHRITETAYYQAGKIVVQTLLPEQPPVPLITLDTFGTTSSTSVDTYIPIESKNQCCSFLESRLISLYGGKAASFLIEYQSALSTKLIENKLTVKPKKTSSAYGSKIYCAGIGNNIFQSTIGHLEIQIATRLAIIMVNYWNFYSFSNKRPINFLQSFALHDKWKCVDLQFGLVSQINSFQLANPLLSFCSKKVKLKILSKEKGTKLQHLIENNDESLLFHQRKEIGYPLTPLFRYPVSQKKIEGRKIINEIDTAALNKTSKINYTAELPSHLLKFFLENRIARQNFLEAKHKSPFLEFYLRSTLFSFLLGNVLRDQSLVEKKDNKKLNVLSVGRPVINQVDRKIRLSSNVSLKSINLVDNKLINLDLPYEFLFEKLQKNLVKTKIFLSGEDNKPSTKVMEKSLGIFPFLTSKAGQGNNSRFNDSLLGIDNISINSIDSVDSALLRDGNKSTNFVSNSTFFALREKPFLKTLNEKYLRFAISQSKNSLKIFKKSANKRNSYSKLRTSVENIAGRNANFSKFYSQINAFQLINSLQFSNLQRNRFYPGWFRLYLPDIEATQYFKNVTNYYFNLGLQTLTRPSLNTLKFPPISSYCTPTDLVGGNEIINQVDRYGTLQVNQTGLLVVKRWSNGLQSATKLPELSVAKQSFAKKLIDSYASLPTTKTKNRFNILLTSSMLSKNEKRNQISQIDISCFENQIQKVFIRRGLIDLLDRRRNTSSIVAKLVVRNQLSELTKWVVDAKQGLSIIDGVDRLPRSLVGNKVAGVIPEVESVYSDILSVWEKGLLSPTLRYFVDIKSFFYNTTNNLSIGVGLLRNAAKRRNQLNQVEHRNKALPISLMLFRSSSKKVSSAKQGVLNGVERLPRFANINRVDKFQFSDVRVKKSSTLLSNQEQISIPDKQFLSTLLITPENNTSVKLFGLPRLWTIDRIINIGLRQHQLKEFSLVQTCVKSIDAINYIDNSIDSSDFVDNQFYANRSFATDNKETWHTVGIKQLDLSLSLLLENNIFPINYNSLPISEKQLLYHSLVNNCFAKAFYLVNQNRQLLDFFADYLLRFQIVRQHQILYLFSALLLGCK